MTDTRPSRATGEEYADALSGLVDQNVARGRDTGPRPPDEKQGRPKERKESNPIHIVALLLILAGLVGWNVYYLNQPLEPAPPQSQRRAAALKLHHAATAIERYRSERGELPEALAGLNVPRGDFDYVRADTGYTLILRTPETVNEYRSGDDLLELMRRARIRGNR